MGTVLVRTGMMGKGMPPVVFSTKEADNTDHHHLRYASLGGYDTFFAAVGAPAPVAVQSFPHGLETEVADSRVVYLCKRTTVAHGGS